MTPDPRHYGLEHREGASSKTTYGAEASKGDVGEVLHPGRFAVVIPGIFSVRNPAHGPILKAGGDIRTAMILLRRPKGTPSPVLFASAPAIAAFRTTVSPKLEAYSIDNLFDDISGNIALLSLFLIIRTITSLVALNLTSEGRSMLDLYSTSNALPDVVVSAVSKCLRPKSSWVAVVHHVPEDIPSSYSNGFQRVASLLSFAVALRLVSKLADKVVVYHDPTIQRLRSLGISPERMIFNSNGVDLGEVNAVRRSAPPRRRNVAVCVSRLSRQKGIPTLLRVWRQVSLSRPGSRLFLIGAEDSMSVQSVTQLLRSLDIANTVVLRGVVPRRELLSELSSCRISIAPSFVEGWGLSVLESLACGTPVVAWDLEAYRPFRSAVITVPLTDEASFASRIITVLDDDAEWLKRAKASVEAAKPYSWDLVAEREWKLLTEAFDSPASLREH
jgi:glycosyltransferase involved in cell wall biosynthesis